MTAPEILALVCIGAVLYSYALYPLLLALVASAAQGLRDA